MIRIVIVNCVIYKVYYLLEKFERITSSKVELIGHVLILFNNSKLFDLIIKNYYKKV